MTIADAVALRVSLQGQSQVQSGLRGVSSSLQALQAQGRSAQSSMQAAGSAVQRLQPQLSALASAATGGASAMGALGNAGSALAMVLEGPVGIAVAAVTVGIAGLAAQIHLAVAAMGEFEKFRGTELQAQAMFGGMRGKQLASQLQAYSVPAIYDTQAINKLGVGLAGSKAVGIDKAVDTLAAISDALAATGVRDNASFSQAAKAFEQIAGGPKVRDEELNQQLRDVAPALLSILRQEAEKRGQVLGGKDSMSSADFFQMIRDLGASRFKGAQEKMVGDMPSLRWANIMQSFQNKLIPIGEKVAKLVLPVLDELDKALDKVFGSSSFRVYIRNFEGFAKKISGALIDGMEKLSVWYDKNEVSISRMLDAGYSLIDLALDAKLAEIGAVMQAATFQATLLVQALGWLSDQIKAIVEVIQFASGKTRRDEIPLTPEDIAWNKRIKERREREAQAAAPQIPAGSAWGGVGRDALGRPLPGFDKGITRAERNAAMAYAFGSALR